MTTKPIKPTETTKRARFILKDINIDEEKSRDVKVVTITPEIAAQLLELNIKNRDVKKTNVSYLEFEMQAGEFHFNGESIILSVTGYVLDGQHRLMACVSTGKAFQTVLVLGVPDKDMCTIDTGPTRTAVDSMKISYKDEKYLQVKTTVITNIMNRFKKKNKRIVIDGNSRAVPVKLSPKQVVNFYRNDKDTLDKLAIFSTHLYSVSSDRLIPPATIGALIYLTAYEEDSKMVQFLIEFMKDSQTFGDSNIAKKTLALYRGEMRKKMSGRESYTGKVLLNYILNMERIFYRKDASMKIIKNKKYESASFPEFDTDIPPVIDYTIMDAEMDTMNKNRK